MSDLGYGFDISTKVLNLQLKFRQKQAGTQPIGFPGPTATCGCQRRDYPMVWHVSQGDSGLYFVEAPGWRRLFGQPWMWVLIRALHVAWHKPTRMRQIDSAVWAQHGEKPTTVAQKRSANEDCRA